MKTPAGMPAPGAQRGKRGRRPRTEIKRNRILDAAIQRFATQGYRAMLVDELADELGISKGSIFQHFESKEGLFLAAFKRAALSIPAWLDAPPEWKQKGFFGIVRYWLERPAVLTDQEWIAFKVTLMAVYSTDLSMKRNVMRFMADRDPYGARDFIKWGIERGEVRADVDPELIASMLGWMMERYEDRMLSDRQTPQLFRYPDGRPEQAGRRIEQLLELLRGAIGRS